MTTTEADAHVRFRRAIERRALWMAEDAARDLPNLPLEDALQQAPRVSMAHNVEIALRHPFLA